MRFFFNSTPGLPCPPRSQIKGHVARISSAVAKLSWSYTPSRGCGTFTGIDPSLIQRKMCSRFGRVGRRCPPILGEGNGQGGMLMSGGHYCRAFTTSTTRIRPSPHTGRTSRKTRRPHNGRWASQLIIFSTGELRWIEVGDSRGRNRPSSNLFIIVEAQ
ncbi:hypothetical protein PoB_002785800 [Plakobranchus ocellatus]|uniref:Uncharacterized protein n=1 Tax=Plakobranchus ocellatus TaxID=259542 RepID=A0AAV4A3V6_9GAST|nr:hypothetical protein PoB_002785800 [Plakobranchus ocellatus]